MDLEQKKQIIISLIETFKEAGKTALKLRKAGLKKEIKSDNTPVTNGDIEVNNILTKKISTLTSQIPIVSEENSDNKDILNLKNFWLIDPIDGTRDYINNKDEFTLNAALILDRKPALGIINAPAKNRLFYSYGPSMSFEFSNDIEINLFKKNKKLNTTNAVSYSDDLKIEILNFHKEFKVKNFQKMKSSLKFCVVASGEFDLYVAEARACEWDIAAGHAIVEHAGGKITDFNNNDVFYGKKNFQNTSIIVRNKHIL